MKMKNISVYITNIAQMWEFDILAKLKRQFIRASVETAKHTKQARERETSEKKKPERRRRSGEQGQPNIFIHHKQK